MKLIFSIIILMVDFFVSVIFSEFGFAVKDSAFWTNIVFSLVMLATISFVFISDEQGKYLKVNDKNKKIDEFISKTFSYYEKSRKRHLFLNHLKTSMIIRRAKGDPETFKYFFKADIELYDLLKKSINENMEEFSITKTDKKEIVKILKVHKSIIRERNGFLMIFAVLVISLFSLKNIVLFEPIFGLLAFKVCFLLIGCLAIFERHKITKYAAIYDEIMTVLTEDA